MMRRHPVQPSAQHRHHQQQEPPQPLDLIAGVPAERQRQLGGGGLAVTDRAQASSQRSGRWLSFSRHWHSIVCVIFAVSLLADASVVSVIWWQWKSSNCSTTQPRCPDDHVSRCTA